MKKPVARRVRLYQSILVWILFAGPVVQSGAQSYPLSSPNSQSTLQVNLSGAGSGLSDWQVGGASQLNQQWFYYSLGSGLVNSIDQIASPSSINNHGGAAPFLSAVYANSTISVTAKFQLNNLPTLTDTLTILNPASSGQTQVYHFYQYSDFDLGGVSGSQSVQFSSDGSGIPYQVTQTGLSGVSYVGTVTATGGGASVSTEAVAGIYDGNQFGLGNGNTTPIFDSSFLNAGPGSVDYAYEWDITLAPGASFQISELQTVTVPEPSSVALVASGMLALALVCRRRLR